MLNTYFNVKTTPIVENLSDVRQHDELLISGFAYYLNVLNKYFHFEIGDLLDRLNKDEDNLPHPNISPRIAEKVINSKSVFIGNTFHSEQFMNLNKYYYDKLVIVNKYYEQIMMFHVNKHHTFSKKVHY